MFIKKTYLVSGVSYGMGKAFAELLVSEGHEVIAIVRDKTSVNTKNFSEIIELDFAHPETIEAKFSNFKSRIDCFINFAALLPGKSYKEYDCASLQELMNINTISPILIIKAIAANINKNGVIVLFGSVSAQKGSYDDAYAASKGAIHSLVKSLALKFAPDIRVVGIAPGMTNDTRMTKELIEGRYEHNLKTIPLARAGEVEDMARIVQFLCSDSAKFITGSLIDVNGGQYLR